VRRDDGRVDPRVSASAPIRRSLAASRSRMTFASSCAAGDGLRCAM